MDNKENHRAGFTRVLDEEKPVKQELVTVSYKVTKKFHRGINLFCADKGIKKIDLFLMATEEYLKKHK